MTELSMVHIPEVLDKETTKNIYMSQRKSNRASEVGWFEDCALYLYAARVDWRLLPPTPLGLQRIFDEGRRQEVQMKRQLEDAGYEVIGVQITEQWEHLDISGRIDGKIGLDKATWPLLELKSCSPNVFRVISRYASASELLRTKYHWVRRYYGQAQAYHLLFNEPLLMILFKNKSTAEWHQVNSELDLEYCERMAKVLEEVNLRIAEKEPWEPVRCEACDWCDFARTRCWVGKDFGGGYDLLNDPDIEVKLDRRKELMPLADEYKDLDTELRKDKFAGKNVIIGNFQITSKEVLTTKLALPKDLREKYSEENRYWKTKIEDLG